MKMIAAVDKNHAIGKDGKLLFRIPSDLKHFREETLGKTCIMGRKTLESMPGGRPLPGRHTIVISRTMKPGCFYEKDGFFAYAVPGKNEALELAASLPEAVVCGGAQIYALFLSDCDKLIITEVENEAIQPDAFFPDYKDGSFRLIKESERTEENGIVYTIREYGRI